jgi:23S rRNA pseudouridine1911/1915/1917 synthase
MSRPLIVTQPTQLQAFLFASFPEMKKLKLKQALKFGSVLVNGRVIKQFDHSLQVGDKVEMRSKEVVQSSRLLPRSMKVHYEDEYLIVIDKPANLLSIASEAEREETAYALLTNYVRQGSPFSHERVWIVHRLDRETSGLMVFARTEEAKRALQDNWEEAEKRYLAIAEGTLPSRQGMLHSHLDERNPFVVFSTPESEHTREAITHYKVMKQVEGLSLVELTLETGRRHQIRVQLAEAGCPIIGDVKYNAKSNPAGRLGLHSCYLRFEHPETGEVLTFDSPLPHALEQVIS